MNKQERFKELVKMVKNKKKNISCKKSFIKRGDVITLKGGDNKGTVLDIQYNKKGLPCSFLIDKGYKTSWVYAHNIVEFKQGF
jgi:signal peptidase I